MLGTIVLCLAAAAWEPPRSAEFEAGYARGREEAGRELEQGLPVLYAYGLLRQTLDRETGLPIVAIAGCIVDKAVLRRAAGHNKRIQEHIAAHGTPEGSYKRWEKELFDLQGAFDVQITAGRTVRLSVGGPPATSPDGRSALGLQQEEAIDPRTAAPSKTSQIRTTSGEVARTISLPWPMHEAKILEVAWGPEDSHVAFLRCDSIPDGKTPQRQFAAVDVRTGRWLRFETEPKSRPSAASPTP